MPVESQHPQYVATLPRWDLVRSIVGNDAKHLIRQIDPNDPTRTQLYRDYAILTNFTNLTKIGLAGLVFKKPVEVSVPDGLAYILEDVTGEGLNIEQFDQRIVGELLMTGRYGILVDAPNVPEGLAAADYTNNNLVARLKCYAAESIINYRVAQVGTDIKLVQVVLREAIDKVLSDGFEWSRETQYRVIFINQDGNAEQCIYIQNTQQSYDNKVSFSKLEGSEVILKDYYGNIWKDIPFKFLGSENNDEKMDNIPLYDIAVLNQGHYRNSADLEESGHLVGQPTLAVSTSSGTEELKAANPAGLKFGSRQALVFGEGSTIQLLQANPNQMIAQMMADKKDYAAALGARLIAPAGGRETAEAARIRFGSQNSALYTLTKNVSLGVTQALKWAARYMGVDETQITHELNDKFYDDAADPVLIAQELLMVQNQVMTVAEFRDNRRSDGTIDVDSTDDEIPTAIHAVDPLAGAYGS